MKTVKSREVSACARQVSCALAVCLFAGLACGAEVPRFNRDIKPILYENCVVCHGPDAKKEGTQLRLDSREAATADLGGYQAVQPGKPEASELWRRISAKDPLDKMPPPDSHKALSPGQQALLKAWILADAPWEGHWAYMPVASPEPPHVDAPAEPVNDIDRFVWRAAGDAGIEPSGQADPVTLVRRLYFDLTGLPPSLEEARDFASGGPELYEDTVDALLASPRFGERMASYWLDLVRYADTIGYHSDNPMPVAPYREYVIRAFNANMPFDEFTREQLAADYFEAPTDEQLTATAYLRLNQKTEEGGAQALEYRAIMQADRVRNLSEVWLGSTMGCAQCHDHKYDPFTQKDFYSMAAFFADIDAPDLYHRDNKQGAKLTLLKPELKERLADLDAELEAVDAALNAETPELAAAQREWEDALKASIDGGKSEDVPWLDDKSLVKGGLSKEQLAALRAAPDARAEDAAKSLRDFFRARTPLLAKENARRAEIEAGRGEIMARAAEVLISRVKEPFTVRILGRGNWMDESGQVVTPAIPEVFGKLDTRNAPATRLDLANWLVDPGNPLTARVFVNRMWMLFFGRGISTSTDDFGAQGAYPAHPDLLDFLAHRFAESGWDVKGLVKYIVMSRTYRQTSRPSPALRARDPFNALFARQGRFRLDAEMIRDNALAISGLLVERIGGPSAKPYQPEGYYAQLNFPKRSYEEDWGENQYRRGVYMHWQRTFLHPMLKAFDAPSREECTAQRRQSNTPLQSLTLLNDPTFVEAARVFAARILRDADTPDGRIALAYARALDRAPDSETETILASLLEQHQAYYSEHPKEAEVLLATGLAPAPEDLDPAEVAAFTAVTRCILNLHETITRY